MMSIFITAGVRAAEDALVLARKSGAHAMLLANMKTHVGEARNICEKFFSGKGLDLDMASAFATAVLQNEASVLVFEEEKIRGIGRYKRIRSPPVKESTLPKVLIIGDSISIDYTVPVRENLNGIADVFRPAWNCQDSECGLAYIGKWLGKGKWDVIHFNSGIWDTHLLDSRGQDCFCGKET